MIEHSATWEPQPPGVVGYLSQSSAVTQFGVNHVNKHFSSFCHLSEDAAKDFHHQLLKTQLSEMHKKKKSFAIRKNDKFLSG